MKQTILGKLVAMKAAQDPSFGRRLNNLPHNSPARLKLAKRKTKRKRK